MTAVALDPQHIERLTRHVSLDEIPDSQDLMSATDVEECLAGMQHPGCDLLAAGDIMLGKRTLPFLETHGADYPLAAVRPLLQRSELVVANLEGPLARDARKQSRRFSYRVEPGTAVALASAGIRVVTLANNHLVDCGRAGVAETLRAVAQAGLIPVGAGPDVKGAHAPAIVQTRNGSIGVLGYYWNRRCAATDKHPGSAMDDAAALAEDIGALRPRVELLFVTFHWGVPYEREPSQADRDKARLAVDCGADIVVAHHPHVIQPFEVYRGRPIFFSVGNFAFGSGNTHAEGLLVGARLCDRELVVEVFPLYVKNRDPRVAYQPKLLRGRSAERVLRRLASVSGDSGRQLEIDGWRGILRLPRGRQS
jgi:poly-gamma-glutamate capsule biosynthesis protein CapA/YwtB (metallophosphatase superfamily)